MAANQPPNNGIPGTISWQVGTVDRVTVETYRVKTFRFQLPEWRTFRPGQHFGVRLTAPDGYQAQRSYSIGSAPEMEGSIDLTIETIPEGEVSPYFHEVVRPGDEIEMRGPIGGPFTWTKDVGGPLLLVAGGSGIVPLMSMLRHQTISAPQIPALLLYSSRSVADIIYRQELEQSNVSNPNLKVLHTLTRSRPPDWQGYSRRIDGPMLEGAIGILEGTPHVFICGPTSFVEAVADALVRLGLAPDRIRTERFGPSA